VEQADLNSRGFAERNEWLCESRGTGLSATKKEKEEWEVSKYVLGQQPFSDVECDR